MRRAPVPEVREQKDEFGAKYWWNSLCIPKAWHSSPWTKSLRASGLLFRGLRRPRRLDMIRGMWAASFEVYSSGIRGLRLWALDGGFIFAARDA